MLKKNGSSIKDLLEREQPDLLCIQEHKLQEKDVEEHVRIFQTQCPAYETHWTCSGPPKAKGYAGVAMFTRTNKIHNHNHDGDDDDGGGGGGGDTPTTTTTTTTTRDNNRHRHDANKKNEINNNHNAPLGVYHGIGFPDADQEGRTLTVEYPLFYVVGCYVPNAGEGLKRLDFRIEEWDVHLAKHVEKLQTVGLGKKEKDKTAKQKTLFQMTGGGEPGKVSTVSSSSSTRGGPKPVIYVGDLNVAHREIDIHNPKGNEKSAGFTPQERASFEEKLLGERRLVDAFRAQHPDVVAYTYWSFRFGMRAKNKGWRLDYTLIDAKIHAEMCYDAYILKGVEGSDHCPVGCVLRLSPEEEGHTKAMMEQ